MLKRNPNDASVKSNLAEAYYIRGLLFTSTKEHAKAIEAYNKAIDCELNHIEAFYRRGWENTLANNYDQAIEDFDKVYQSRPDDAQARKDLANAYSARAVAYCKEEKYDKAIPDFNETPQGKPCGIF